MVTHNVFIENGVVNGSIWTVIDISLDHISLKIKNINSQKTYDLGLTNFIIHFMHLDELPIELSSYMTTMRELSVQMYKIGIQSKDSLIYQ